MEKNTVPGQNCLLRDSFCPREGRKAADYFPVYGCFFSKGCYNETSRNRTVLCRVYKERFRPVKTESEGSLWMNPM